MDNATKKLKEQGKRAPIAFPDFDEDEIEKANAYLNKKSYDAEEVKKISNEKFNIVLNEFLPVERTNNTEWCICEHCTNDPKVRQNFCCREVALSSNFPAEKKNLVAITDKFKEKFRSGGHICITKSASFDVVMLNEEVLSVWIEDDKADKKKRRDIDQKLEEDRNCVFRYYAYRSFVRWAYGHLSRGQRYEIPSCVRAKIINAFPSANGYTGFKISNLALFDSVY